MLRHKLQQAAVFVRHLEPGVVVVIVIKITESTAATNNGEVLGNLFLVFNLENIFIKNKIPLTWRYWEAAALGNWPLTGKFTSEV